MAAGPVQFNFGEEGIRDLQARIDGLKNSLSGLTQPVQNLEKGFHVLRDVAVGAFVGSGIVRSVTDFQKKLYDLSRTATFTGQSFTSLKTAMETINKGTTLSRNEAATLIKTMNDMTRGVKLSAGAMSDYARVLTQEFGPSLEEAQEAFKDLAEIQHKEVFLLDRLHKGMSVKELDSYSASLILSGKANEKNIQTLYRAGAAISGHGRELSKEEQKLRDFRNATQQLTKTWENLKLDIGLPAIQSLSQMTKGLADLTLQVSKILRDSPALQKALTFGPLVAGGVALASVLGGMTKNVFALVKAPMALMSGTTAGRSSGGAGALTGGGGIMGGIRSLFGGGREPVPVTVVGGKPDVLTPGGAAAGAAGRMGFGGRLVRGAVGAAAGAGVAYGAEALGQKVGGEAGTAIGAAGGIAGGAMTGASMGSIIGPWGTVIGAIMGGVTGLMPHLEKLKEMFPSLAKPIAMIQSIFGDTVKMMQPVLDRMKESFLGIMEAVKPLLPVAARFIGALAKLWMTLQGIVIRLLTPIVKVALRGLEGILTALTPLLDAVTGALEAFAESLSSVLDSVSGDENLAAAAANRKAVAEANREASAKWSGRQRTDVETHAKGMGLGGYDDVKAQYEALKDAAGNARDFAKLTLVQKKHAIGMLAEIKGTEEAMAVSRDHAEETVVAMAQRRAMMAYLVATEKKIGESEDEFKKRAQQMITETVGGRRTNVALLEAGRTGAERYIPEVQKSLAGTALGETKVSKGDIDRLGHQQILGTLSRMSEIAKNVRENLQETIGYQSTIAEYFADIMGDREKATELERSNLSLYDAQARSLREVRDYAKQFLDAGMSADDAAEELRSILEKQGVAEGDIVAKIQALNVAMQGPHAVEAAMSKIAMDRLSSYDKMVANSERFTKVLASQVSLQEAQLNLFKSMNLGLGPTLDMQMQLLDAINKENESLEKSIAYRREQIASGEGSQRVQAELNDMLTRQVGLQQKAVDLTKTLREGYLDAMQTMTNAEGTFAKMVTSKQLGAAQMQRTFGAGGGARMGMAGAGAEKPMIAWGAGGAFTYKRDYGQVSKGYGVVYGQRQMLGPNVAGAIQQSGAGEYYGGQGAKSVFSGAARSPAFSMVGGAPGGAVPRGFPAAGSVPPGTIIGGGPGAPEEKTKEQATAEQILEVLKDIRDHVRLTGGKGPAGGPSGVGGKTGIPALDAAMEATVHAAQAKAAADTKAQSVSEEQEKTALAASQASFDQKAVAQKSLQIYMEKQEQRGLDAWQKKLDVGSMMAGVNTAGVGIGRDRGSVSGVEYSAPGPAGTRMGQDKERAYQAQRKKHREQWKQSVRLMEQGVPTQLALPGPEGPGGNLPTAPAAIAMPEATAVAMGTGPEAAKGATGAIGAPARSVKDIIAAKLAAQKELKDLEKQTEAQEIEASNKKILAATFAKERMEAEEKLAAKPAEGTAFGAAFRGAWTDLTTWGHGAKPARGPASPDEAMQDFLTQTTESYDVTQGGSAEPRESRKTLEAQIASFSAIEKSASEDSAKAAQSVAANKQKSQETSAKLRILDEQHHNLGVQTVADLGRQRKAQKAVEAAAKPKGSIRALGDTAKQLGVAEGTLIPMGGKRQAGQYVEGEGGTKRVVTQEQFKAENAKLAEQWNAKSKEQTSLLQQAKDFPDFAEKFNAAAAEVGNQMTAIDAARAKSVEETIVKVAKAPGAYSETGEKFQPEQRAAGIYDPETGAIIKAITDSSKEQVKATEDVGSDQVKATKDAAQTAQAATDAGGALQETATVSSTSGPYVFQPKDAVQQQTGGRVPGMGSGDIIPALLEPGEFVINKKSAKMFGPLIAAINEARGFQAGGAVAPSAALAMGGAGGGGFSPRFSISVRGDTMKSIMTSVNRQLAGAVNDILSPTGTSGRNYDMIRQ